MPHHPNIAIRVDASLTMGTGHAMRMLTLADALRQRGANIEFVCRTHPGNLIEAIIEQGYHCHQLPLHTATLNAGNGTPHAAWLGASWQEDATATQQALSHKTYDWLIVDHYALDSQWERAMRPYTDKILVIDDLADRHHDADLLLDQTLGRTPEAYQKLVPRTTQCLTGTTYALVRPEFSAIRDNARLHRAHRFPPKNLLIFFGGTDAENLTGNLLAHFEQHPFAQIDVVLGQHAPHRDAVAAQCRTINGTLHIQCKNMAQLMSRADLAFGAPGTASWERCTVGLPTMLILGAANQQANAHALATAGVAIVLGDKTNDMSLMLSQALHTIASLDQTTYRQWVERCFAVCDGQGAQKIASYLVP